MQTFPIQFTNAWFLLLLIPALFLTFFPYFRLAKKYRRTRNRVTSIVLHTLCMVFAISMLSGMTIHYNIPNKDNEIILLVDVSETEEYSAETRDDFVRRVIDDASYDNYKVAVVTFGFDQVLAVPFTYDVESAYDTYVKAEKPDTSATDICSALTYARDMFENPESAKIVLITDGKETDQKVSSVIRSISAKGIKIDTAYVPSEYGATDALITGVQFPDSIIKIGESVDIGVSVKSKVVSDASDAKIDVTISMFDNGVEDVTARQTVLLSSGTRELTFKHIFAANTEGEGFHELKFVLTSVRDGEELNNTYITYTVIENYNKILILESKDAESDLLENILDTEQFKQLNEEGEQESSVKVMNILTQAEAEEFPKTVADLRKYDQIILNNVSFTDMPEGFEEMLYEYVHDYGGGLFTVGGNDAEGQVHGYNRVDVGQSKYYKQMLPVDLINYTPSVGLFIIVDRSGSMASTDDDGRKFIDLAKAGALASVGALTERDYVGLMSLDSDKEILLELTPSTDEDAISEGFNKLKDAGGGTTYTDALNSAGYLLKTFSKVEKRHIMIVSDGQPNEEAVKYESIVQQYHDNDGITFSVVIIGQNRPADADDLDRLPVDQISDSNAYGKCLRIAKLGGGKLHWVSSSNTNDLSAAMREDLNMKEIKEFEQKDFNPTVNDNLSSIFKGIEVSSNNKMSVVLKGFYGAKIKKDAELLLVGDYEVPVYAQWKYGNGRVGSFMSDLNGNWSEGFINGTKEDGSKDLNGVSLIINIITNLMPNKNIRPNEISVGLDEDNYTNKMSVYTQLQEGESVEGTISRVVSDGEIKDEEENDVSLNVVGGNKDYYVTSALDKSNNYSRCNFVIKKSGVYKITFVKTDANGNTSELVVYKDFSYSEEYDTSIESEEIDYKQKLADIAKNGNGAVVEDLEDPSSIFETFVTKLERIYDPRWLFAILSIVCFLLDIIVRKFKFKWPHEIYEEYKKKKNNCN